MKINISKALPVVAFACAVFSAFAFNSSKQAVADYPGVIQVSTMPWQCDDTDITCSDVFNSVRCSDGTHELFRLNAAGTSCSAPLYRIP